MNLKFLLIIIALITTMGCKKSAATAESTNNQIEEGVSVVEEDDATVSKPKFNPDISIILVPFDYEAYDYRTDEDFNTDDIVIRDENAPIYNPNDSIATGITTDEGSFTGLFGRLALDKKWLCIQLRNRESDTKPTVDIAHTKSYSIDWLEDSVTVLSTAKEREINCFYDIAFKGDYGVKDYQEISANLIEPTSDEAKQLVSQLRKAIPAKRMRKMFRMSSDTLILKDIFVPNISYKKVYAMTFATPTFNDSDADFSNEVIFLFEGGKIRYVDSGFHCASYYFKLKSKDYLLIKSNTYADGYSYLFDIKSSLEKDVFNIGKAGD